MKDLELRKEDLISRYGARGKVQRVQGTAALVVWVDIVANRVHQEYEWLERPWTAIELVARRAGS